MERWLLLISANVLPALADSLRTHLFFFVSINLVGNASKKSTAPASTRASLARLTRLMTVLADHEQVRASNGSHPLFHLTDALWTAHSPRVKAGTSAHKTVGQANLVGGSCHDIWLGRTVLQQNRVAIIRLLIFLLFIYIDHAEDNGVRSQRHAFVDG